MSWHTCPARAQWIILSTEDGRREKTWPMTIVQDPWTLLLICCQIPVTITYMWTLTWTMHIPTNWQKQGNGTFSRKNKRCLWVLCMYIKCILNKSDNIYFWCNFPCLFHIFHIVLCEVMPQCTIFEKDGGEKKRKFNGFLFSVLGCLLRFKSWLLSLLIKLSGHRQKKGIQVCCVRLCEEVIESHRLVMLVY